MNELTPGLFEGEVNLVQASHGKRLANYLIDGIVYLVILFSFGIVMSLIAPDAVHSFSELLDDSVIIERLISLLTYGLMAGALEAIFKGKSPAKFFTGTRAVKQSGKPITAGDAFLRGLVRAIPFEAFSAFGTPCYPWHDKWTDTFVVEDQSLILADA